MVRNIRGVTGIPNNITIALPASPVVVEDAIEDTFKREVEVDARHMRVEVSDHREAVGTRALAEGGECGEGGRRRRAGSRHCGESPPGPAGLNLVTRGLPGR
jgi:hypothetical protein